jgi:hypothetical protein
MILQSMPNLSMSVCLEKDTYVFSPTSLWTDLTEVGGPEFGQLPTLAAASPLAVDQAA